MRMQGSTQLRVAVFEVWKTVKQANKNTAGRKAVCAGVQRQEREVQETTSISVLIDNKMEVDAGGRGEMSLERQAKTSSLSFTCHVKWS